MEKYSPSAPVAEGKRKAAQIAVTCLDAVCLYTVEADASAVRKAGRFEKDYLVALDPGPELAALRKASVRINGKSHNWLDVLGGTKFDYLPRTLDTVITGMAAKGVPVVVRKLIVPQEPALPGE